MSEPKYTIDNQPLMHFEDAVIMAVYGTSYSAAMWWLEAIRIVDQTLHGEVGQQTQAIMDYLGCAIHADDE